MIIDCNKLFLGSELVFVGLKNLYVCVIEI